MPNTSNKKLCYCGVSYNDHLRCERCSLLIHEGTLCEECKKTDVEKKISNRCGFCGKKIPLSKERYASIGNCCFKCSAKASEKTHQKKTKKYGK